MYEEYKKRAEEIFNRLKKVNEYCIAIYLGGSIVDPEINNPGDVDYIFFTEYPRKMSSVRYSIEKYCSDDKTDKEDFIQIRNATNEEHAYGSYINKLMIPLVGEKINFTFDIINKDRKEYIQILKIAKEKWTKFKFRNPKRWYQMLRGVYILKNNSYTLTKEQKENVNKLHDDALKYPELIEYCKQEIDKL